MEIFPRKSGHCESFDVSNLKIVKDLKKQGVRFDIFVSENVDYEAVFKKVLTRLMSNKLVIKGDLILFCGNGYRNDGVTICDGNKLIELDDEYDDYGSVPKCFTVITNGVPPEYWADLPNMRGVRHNSIVWFDHTPIKQQCLDGIKAIDGRVTIIFDYQGRVYTLYDMTDDQYNDAADDSESYEGDVIGKEDAQYNVEERLQIVTSKLESDELMMLSYDEDTDGSIKLFIGSQFLY